MTVFLDTSGLYAVFDRHDANHPRPLEWNGFTKGRCS
jgi:predicted nucleic acid-binding protein